MFDVEACGGRPGPLPMGDEDLGERALRPYYMLHDLLYLEDEMHEPIAEANDLAEFALDEIERVYEGLLAQQAVLAEKIEAGRRAFGNQRDMIVIDSGSPRCDSDEDLRRAYCAEVATRLNLSDRSASNLIEESKTVINDLPELADAWRLGWVSQQHVRSAARQAWSIPAEARRGFDAAVVGKARTQTPSRFSSTARITRERLHPESIETRKKEALEQRQVETFAEADGMAGITLHHSADIVLSIEDRIRVLARRRKNETPGEQRTLAQLGADIVAEALLTQLGMETLRLGAFGQDTTPPVDTDEPADTHTPADTDAPADSTVTHARIPAPGTNAGDQQTPETTSKTEETGAQTVPGTDLGLTPAQLAALRPGVIITVPAATLTGDSDEPAILNGYGPIDRGTANRLISQAASAHRILTDPVTGSTIEIDPTKYRLSEPLKRFIRTRDATCGFPGCTIPAERCEIDHILAWSKGGTSTPENLLCLCSRHHRVKHSTRWRTERNDDGTITWTSPTGARWHTHNGETHRDKTNRTE